MRRSIKFAAPLLGFAFIALGLLLSSSQLSLAAQAALDAIPDHIRQAVADPGRPRYMVARDAQSKAAEVLTFAQIKPGMVVAELYPDGYYTRLLSKVIGERGRLYGLTLLQTYAEAAQLRHRQSAYETTASGPLFVDRLLEIENVTEYANFTDIWHWTAGNFGGHVALPEQIDVMWLDHYHDLHDAPVGAPDMVEVNRSIFKSMKPGGVYLIQDTDAQPGAGFSVVETLHRTDREAVKREVMQAGFVLEAESPILEDPEDRRDIMMQAPANGRDGGRQLKRMQHQSRYLFRFRKPLNSPDTANRPQAGQPDPMMPYYGNTLVVDDAEPRHLMFERDGRFYDFGAGGPGRYELRSGTWFLDAYGATCMRREFPWQERALTLCMDLTSVPTLGQPYSQPLSDGRRAPATLLSGHVRPAPSPASIAAGSTPSTPSTPANVSAAIADIGRPTSMLAQDAAKQPAQALVLAGIRPGMSVAEIYPDGYFTRLLSKTIGPEGRLYGIVPLESEAEALVIRTRMMRSRQPEELLEPGVDDSVAYSMATGSIPSDYLIDQVLSIENDSNYPNLTTMWQWLGQFGGSVSLPRQVDAVWFDHYQDLGDQLTGKLEARAFNRALFGVLKANGVYLVGNLPQIGRAGTASKAAPEPDIAAVKQEIVAAGFVFETEVRLPSGDGAANRVLLRFRKPTGAALRSNSRETARFEGSTLVLGEGAARRHLLLGKSGSYQEFGRDMVPKWALAGIGIEASALDLNAGTWFQDTHRRLCLRQEYPLIFRGRVNCLESAQSPTLDKPGEFILPGGGNLKASLLPGVQYPE